MSKQLKQLFLNLLWLGGLAGLAVVVILLLSNTRPPQTAQAPEPTPVPLSTATPPAARFDSPIATPTTIVEVTEIPTATVEPVDTPTATAEPTSELTPSLVPTDILPTLTPVPGAAGAILYLQYDSEQKLLHRLPVDDSSEPVAAPIPVEASAGLANAANSAIGAIYPSPNRKFAALVSGVETGHQVVLYDFTTGQILPLLREHSATLGYVGFFLGWSADSQSVLYRADVGQPGVWLVDVVQGSYRFLSELEAEGGALSPDGKQAILATHLLSGLEDRGEVWMVDIATGEHQLLFSGDGPHFGVTWSPDGNHVAYVGDCSKEQTVTVQRPDGKEFRTSYGLCVMNPDGTDRRLLTVNFTVGYGFYPIWSPNSRLLAFGVLDGPRAAIKENEVPNWDKIAFSGANIHLIDIVTGEERHLVPDSKEGNIDPAWSPDGEKIIFASNRSGSEEIWAIKVDGTELRQLTSDGKLHRFPVWGTQ